ncbi:flagellar basal body-associated FliL family protein [Fundidesulfovibrio putealis]|uniref:flagellar basal body-associated FliL family protein n=1 Tax=Fundidesulfovibrio putealis TaxID=270496 RepID=UPI000486E03A|nr:flagellar basal body-associated FliL family protein [Fundidesulfovibrio putealis]
MAKGNDAGDLDVPKKKGKLLVIIILIMSIAVLGGGGYFAYMKFFKAPNSNPIEEGQTPSEVESGGSLKAEGKSAPAKEEKKDDKKSGNKKDDKVAPVTSINNIVTNLADPGGRRYIRMSVEFEFKDDSVAHEFSDKYQMRVKDAILTLLWSKSSDTLSVVEGMSTLKEDIKSRVNQIMGPGAVKQVFILDRVIQ